MKRRMICLLAAVLLVALLPMTAAADAWIPPEGGGYDLELLPEIQGECKALNTFLSNYAETNLSYYDSQSGKDVAVATVLKHLELNAGLFPYDVFAMEEDGVRYMRVSESAFERRMWLMFGKEYDAASLKGYAGGYVVVTAENFGGPIRVFASASRCRALGEGRYRVEFDVFYVDKDFGNWYSVPNSRLPMDCVTKLGSGEAIFLYDDASGADGLTSADFSLVKWQMSASGIPCTNENRPYGEEIPQETPGTEPESQETSEATEDTQPSEQTEQTKPDKPDEEEHREDYKRREKDTGATTLILIVVLVVAVAVFALAVILLLFRRKK